MLLNLRSGTGAARGRSLLHAVCWLALCTGWAACTGAPPSNESTARRAPAPRQVRQGPEPARGAPVALRGEWVELPNAPEFDAVAELEFARSLGNGRLLALLRHADDRVRMRAARALGRMPFPEFGAEVTDALCEQLEDQVSGVRSAVAFALGLRGDPSSEGVLAAYRNDRDPRLRSRVVEALSRLEDQALHEELLVALRDGDPRVRIEAAIGTARWDPDAPDADDVDRALLDALRPYALDANSRRDANVRIEPEFVWRVLYALSRRRAELGRGAFLEYASSPVALERLFAVRGLSRISPSDEGAAALIAAITGEDDDWRVVYEAALGLGAWGDPAALGTLEKAAEHKSSHVRAAAFEALGNFPAQRETALSTLRRGLLDVSPGNRTAALEAMTRVLDVDEALETLERHADATDAVVRSGVARAAGGIADARALSLLTMLAGDRDPRVATSAVESLAQHPGGSTRGLLHSFLEHEDNGMRLAAVLALREMADPSDVIPLERALRTSQGDIANEIAFNCVVNLGAIGGDRAMAVAGRAVTDPRPYVRRVARRVLQEDFGVAAEAIPPGVARHAPSEGAPLPGVDFPRYDFNPMVEVETSRGSLIFELFPAEAPVHVHNFLELAERGHYVGLNFHRVVPDFVIQGGDYRGDGNGARPWQGDALPQEFGMRKTTRGSLGMPRNDDPDSGGSQFFVTHRPTPHLDGRYTIFGELRSGGEVLDRVEVGDRILGVRLLR